MRLNKSLAIGLACGACCAGCVGLYVLQVNNQAELAREEMLARYGGEQLEVCVAKRDIAAGETIEESALETKMWVSALLPEGAVVQTQEAVGQQVATTILKGEVVSSRRFGSPVYSLEVPEGLTAVSVPARDVQAVGGALIAGMRADVYAVGSNSTSKVISQALVVATNASEQSSSGSSSSVAWVTLAVPPESVEELVSAAQNLELYFVLPSSSDEMVEPAVQSTSNEDSAAESKDSATTADSKNAAKE